MTAWSQLVANSSLTSGSAWEHLNAQASGSGVVYVEGMSVDVLDAVPTAVLQVDVFESVFAESTLSANVNDVHLSSTFLSISFGAAVAVAVYSAGLLDTILSAALLEETI